MRALDYAVAGALGLGNFILAFWRYWVPGDRIFDEVYFARAATEYLQNVRIYENTHPPLTKLLITLSVMLFGGMPHGNNSYGWRFLDVVAGAVSVVILYALAKRVTDSTLFAAVASLLFTFDGMHFVQSRIATPESFVVCFSLFAAYALYRFWLAARSDADASPGMPPWARAATAGVCLLVGACSVAIWKLVVPSSDPSSPGTAIAIVAAIYIALGCYLIARHVDFRRPAGLWLAIFSATFGLLSGSKWYGITMGLAGIAVLILLRLERPHGFRFDGAAATIVFVAMTAYGLVWVPDLVRHGRDDIANVNDVVYRQYTMYMYHSTLTATHPYASKWWEWPLDYVPVAYYYQDRRTDQADPHGCCIYEITTLPNPLNMWLGLLTVPFAGYLGWRYRNKGYVLIVLIYLAQWLPWSRVPRVAWEYHFYVNIPLICLCNAIALQQLWKWSGEKYGEKGRLWGGVAVAGTVLAIGLAFAFFFPVLAALPLTWDAWHQRMWIDKWIIGPG
jgi:dolichyl-phosphate-mannose-protein mannosyltransferase